MMRILIFCICSLFFWSGTSVGSSAATLSSLVAGDSLTSNGIEVDDFSFAASAASGSIDTSAFTVGAISNTDRIGLIFKFRPYPTLNLDILESFELLFGLSVTTPDVGGTSSSVPALINGVEVFITSGAGRGDAVIQVGSASPNLLATFSSDFRNVRDESEIVPKQSFDFDFYVRGDRITPDSGGVISEVRVFFDMTDPVVVPLPLSGASLVLGLLAMAGVRMTSRLVVSAPVFRDV